MVIQIDAANAASPHTIIIPFTTKIRETVLPSHVRFPPGTAGLRETSVLLCEQIRVIDKKRLMRRLGHTSASGLEEAEAGVRRILGLQ